MPVDAHVRSASRFTLIGALAALTHYVAAVGLEQLGLAAAWANPVGFLCAFPVSYYGHRRWSFEQPACAHRQTLPRFLLVASGGFCANQLLVLLGLRWLTLPFWLLLGLVMGVVAAATYLLSRYWAFAAR